MASEDGVRRGMKGDYHARGCGKGREGQRLDNGEGCTGALFPCRALTRQGLLREELLEVVDCRGHAISMKILDATQLPIRDDTLQAPLQAQLRRRGIPARYNVRVRVGTVVLASSRCAHCWTDVWPYRGRFCVDYQEIGPDVYLLITNKSVRVTHE